MPGQPGPVATALLIPGQYSVQFSAVATDTGRLPTLSYSVLGNVISDPIGPIIHDPTYKPIYLGPPGPTTTYLYPNGAIRAVPYFWLTL